MISKIAIWYLRKKKASVIINCQIDNAEVQFLGNKGNIYDNKFNNTLIRLVDGSTLMVPNGSKFNIKKKVVAE